MRKLRFILSIILVMLLVSACSAGSEAVQILPTAQMSVENNHLTSHTAPTAALTLAEDVNTHESAGDYVVDLAAAVPITFNGGSISADGAGITVNGSVVTITAPGDYRLSGSLADGQVVVDSAGDGAVRLILDNVTLNSSTGSPLYIMDAEKVVIDLVDGSSNVITDADHYVFPSAEVDEPNAAIFSKADLSIGGNGSLAVSGNFNDGIHSTDGLVIAGGSLVVTAVDDGIRGKDYLVVHGGSLTVTVGGDGLKSDLQEDAAQGYIAISAGTLNVTAGGDAISAQTAVTVTGGDFILTTGGGAGNLVADALSAKGMKGGTEVVITAGSFNINSADDSIHSDGTITIHEGVFTLASADDALHADAALTINGGDIQVTRSYEGLESSVITLNAGTIHVSSSDDGINVAGGVDGSGMMRGKGGPGGGDQDAATYTGDLHLYINGTYLFVDAQGDGIDVGGAIEMQSGVVIVNGPTEHMNGALDYDGGFNMSGGFLVATGSAGMAMTAGSYSTQNAILVYLSNTQAGGTPLHIQDSTGKEILTFTPTRDYQSIAFSSPDLGEGQSYTVYTGGSTSGTLVDGLAQGGTYTPGTQSASFTINNIVTTVGTGGMGPGRGPRR